MAGSDEMLSRSVYIFVPGCRLPDPLTVNVEDADCVQPADPADLHQLTALPAVCQGINNLYN